MNYAIITGKNTMMLSLSQKLIYFGIFLENYAIFHENYGIIHEKYVLSPIINNGKITKCVSVIMAFFAKESMKNAIFHALELSRLGAVKSANEV